MTVLGYRSIESIIEQAVEVGDKIFFRVGKMSNQPSVFSAPFTIYYNALIDGKSLTEPPFKVSLWNNIL